MKYISVSICLAALAVAAHAEPFKVDPDHTEIGFSVRHLMLSDVSGGFNTFEGTVEYDLAKNTLVSLAGTIETASIDTNNGKRDNHLKNADFFDTGKFPEMSFKSTAVEKAGENSYQVTGKLTVLGVERKVVLPVTVVGPVDDPWGNKRIGLSCKTTLNRRDLGITNSPATMIGDEVSIDISSEAIFPLPKPADG